MQLERCSADQVPSRQRLELHPAIRLPKVLVHSNISVWAGAGVGVARAAAAAQGDPWGSIRGGITVLGRIGHVRTIRTAHSWHIGRFDDDN